MSGLRRSLADLACHVLQSMLPPGLQPWGQAIRCETTAIEDDTRALLFALDSVCGLLPRVAASRLLRFLDPPAGGETSHTGDPSIMAAFDALLHRPRIVGIACATGGVMLGLAYMAIAGAPSRYIAINAGALAIGLTMLWVIGRATVTGRHQSGRAIIVMAGALMATALLGDRVDGAARWVNMGGLSLQPSLILLPVMIVTFAGRRDAFTTGGIVVGAIAMALQPDRAMAGALAMALAVLAAMRPDRHTLSAFGAGLSGFAVTLLRDDRLPAVPYVDQILHSSFDIHVAVGMALSGGSILLVVPAIIGWTRDPADRARHAVFGAVWSAVIAAAALGNYPTPIVGYGGSAIIGYALSLLALPRRIAAPVDTGLRGRHEAAPGPVERHMLVALA